MASRSCSTNPATTLESFPLSANRVMALFSSSFLDNSSICLKVLRRPLEKIVAEINQRTYLTNLARRVVSSGSSLTTVVVTICLNLSSCGMSPSIFSLTSLNSWNFRISYTRWSPKLASGYLVMLDERVYPSKWGIEERKAICRFLRDIEENLHAVHSSLFLRWEN